MKGNENFISHNKAFLQLENSFNMKEKNQPKLIQSFTIIQIIKHTLLNFFDFIRKKNMSSSDQQQQQQQIFTRYNFPDFKSNKLNTGLFDLNEDWSSTFEAFCCPTSLAFRLEFALNLDRKVQYFAKKRLTEIKKENPREYHRQLDHYARHVYSRLEQSTENNDLFNGCCHILASGMTLPFALCVTGVFVEKEYFHFEEHYDDDETGVNTFKTKTPQQERDDDSEKGLIACFCSPCQMARMYREVILRGMPMPSLKLEPMAMRTLTGGEKKGRRIMKMISPEEEERDREGDKELQQRNEDVEPSARMTSTSAIEPVDENENENEKNEVDINMAPSAEHQHEQQQEEQEEENKDVKLPEGSLFL